ncbi:MAG: hypothetical protein KME32_29190 [Mojavia pulchra JT2-VF2]|uniref:Uncharacterized protein n=1 Tax=Mojavia pulchra JT2-VF2 TaxID=287848 RepID=A0A951UK72_9NOST|nr:hypothetical protein [Mojavia pulchra JT2-VF2]
MPCPYECIGLNLGLRLLKVRSPMAAGARSHELNIVHNHKRNIFTAVFTYLNHIYHRERCCAIIYRLIAVI